MTYLMRIFFGCKEWETPFSECVINRIAQVGDGVEVTDAAQASAKYTQGKKTYSFPETGSLEKYWFSGWSDAAITVTVVDQETYSE